MRKIKEAHSGFIPSDSNSSRLPPVVCISQRGYVVDVAVAQQDHKAAEEYGRLALQTSGEAGDLFATAHHLRRLAHSAVMAGDSEQALHPPRREQHRRQ